MFVAKLDLKSKIIVVYGGDLCVCERGFVHSVFYYIIIFSFFVFVSFPRPSGPTSQRLQEFQKGRKGKEEETCKVRDMLCHAHVSKPMNPKVYWDLSGV